jgi:3-isopropylmalate/(R)-2-methylmalate dehydratase large subunit
MGMTMIEKILANHAIPPRKNVQHGEFVRVRVDTAGNYARPLPGYRYLKVWNPDRIWMVDEHNVPCYNVVNATTHVHMREFAKRHGIRWIEHGRQGIGHQMASEKGFHIPGCIYAFPDSHTPLGGALNCACKGIGPLEIAGVMAKGETWYHVVPTVKFNLVGTMPSKVMARDLVLYIGGHWPPFVNQNAEFLGPAADAMSLASRQCIACGAVESSFDFILFKADEKVMDFVKARTPWPELINPVEPDDDAEYAEEITIDVSTLVPQLACPHSMDNVSPVTDVAKDPVKIDLAFVGACTNGRLEDIKMAADLVRGKTIHPDVRFIVTPASQEIWTQAVDAGYAKDIVDAQGIFTASRCTPCGGGNLGPGEVAVTSSTRNFKGRMGVPDSTVYCASPATVTASALAGFIADPREVS